MIPFLKDSNPCNPWLLLPLFMRMGAPQAHEKPLRGYHDRSPERAGFRLPRFAAGGIRAGLEEMGNCRGERAFSMGC